MTENEYIMPPALKEGDLVEIISPASALADAALMDDACQTLQHWGLRTRIAQHAGGKAGHFAGTDEERLGDLMNALLDPDVKCILCSRGGYGVLRLLEKADLSCLRNDPKWIIGFSDVTAFHADFSHQGVCSLHAPMAKALAHSHSNKSVLRSMREILMNGKKMRYSCKPVAGNRLGKAKGKLYGGNLSLIYSMQGTPFQFPAEGTILFIEDLAERHYHIDRMMHNLRLSGLLSKLSGLIVGQFSSMPDTDEAFGQSVEEIVMSCVADYGYPVCFGFPVGHEGKNVPLIEGADVKLDVGEKTVVLEQL